jgi:HAD superfamily hydrolase (TIGR01509 family)
MMIKALLFDLDGTLTHTDPIHLRAVQRLLADHDRTIDEAGFREQVSGRSNVEIGLRLFPDRTADEHVALLARKEALFREFALDLVPLAGAIELINQARERGLGLALVTNAPRENVGHMLGAIGASGRFDTIVYGDEMARPKPDPLPYLTGLERLGATADEALAFEDSPPGVQAAKAAGIVTVGVATTRSPEELTAAGADLVIEDFTDERLVERWLAQ